MKYILVTGGVISGVGKGVISSSLGVILKSQGIRVSAIKIDPYINLDAGTFSPYEHGEVFVLNDGAEVDLDLGNYERFLNVQLNKDNNITTGKIYLNVINEERRGSFLGKTVQVIPHITNAIQEWVQRVAAVPVDGTNETPEVCIIELGGTIGDIELMPFAEAFSHFFVNVLKNKGCLNVHVSYLLEPKSTGEQKTKPTQASIRELRRLGLTSDLIVCRCENLIRETAKVKISNFCHVPLEHVIGVHDVNSIYEVPLLLANQNVWQFLAEKLELTQAIKSTVNLSAWSDLIFRMNKATDSVTIAMIKKYVKMKDAYTSVIEALKHAAFYCNLKLDLQFIDSSHLEPESKISEPELYKNAWDSLKRAHGVLVPGGFGDRGIEGKILACGWCRKYDVPMLGICLGLQCAIIEFSRSVLNLEKANSTEFNKNTPHPVVIEMPEHNPGHLGGTMRLGSRKTYFKVENSKIKKLYGDAVVYDPIVKKQYVEERHRHRYEVNPIFVRQLEKFGLHFVGTDLDEKRMEIVELQDHLYYVGVQYHPEYISRPLTPSAPYVGLIQAASTLIGHTEMNHVMNNHVGQGDC